VEPAATTFVPSDQPRNVTVASGFVGAAATVKVEPKATADCVGSELFPPLSAYVTAYVDALHCAVNVTSASGIVKAVVLSYEVAL
jgi:hypothetical protein